MMKNLSAVIVGSRTGRHLKTPVPMLPFGSSTVLNRTLTTYLEAGFSELILCLGYRGGEVQAALGPLADRVTVVIAPDPDEEYGWLVRQGIERLSSSAKAFALGMGDQPLLSKDLLVAMAERFESSGSPILVPVCQNQIGHPVFFDIAVAQEFKRLPANGETWDVIKANAQNVVDYHVYETAVIRHIEDIDDYHDILRLAGLPVPESSGRENGSEQNQDGSRSPGRFDADLRS